LGSKLIRHWPWQYFSGSVSSGKGDKSKIKVLGLHQYKTVLHSEGNNQQNKKAT